MLITAVLPTSIAVVSPALPGMATGLGVSDARIGLVVTAVSLPPMIIAPVVGIASDIYGRRAIAIPGLLLFGIAGVAITLVESFALVLVLRGLQGIAMAGIAPATVTLLGDLYSGVVGTTAQGIRSSTGGMSLVVVPLVAGWLAGIGWEYPFYLYASAFLAVIFVYLYVPETAPEIGTDRRFRESLAAYKRSVKEEVSDVSLLVVMIGGFARFFSLFAFITFIPIFAVRSLGATPFEAGLVVALSGVRIALSPTAGWWVSRFSRRATLLGTLAIQFGIFAVVPLVPNVWWLAGLAVLYGMGDSVFDPVVNDAVTTMVQDRNRNGIVGALRVLKEAGKTGAPVVLGGVLAIGGFASMFASLAAVMACYGLAVLFVVRGGW